MVSQFKSSHKVRLLGDLNYVFPEHIHAIGRLDNESEGLLILTTNKKITRFMYAENKAHLRSYLVMVKNKISAETLLHLQNGIVIPIKGSEPYIAKPISVTLVLAPTDIYAFAKDPREVYPHTWLLITLTEGKFRQVRKMVMSAKHRCLRLIRVSIGNICLDNMLPGQVKELDEDSFFKCLGIGNP